MKRTLLRIAFLIGAVIAVLVAVGLTLAVVADTRNLARSLGGIIRIPVFLALAWGLFVAFRRYGNSAQALPKMADLAGPPPIAELRAFYGEHKLAHVTPVSRTDNPYMPLSTDDLLDVCSKLNPKFPPSGSRRCSQPSSCGSKPPTSPTGD